MAPDCNIFCPSHSATQRAFSIYLKIPENFGNFSGKCLSVKNVFHLTHSSQSFPGSLHRPMYFPPKYKMVEQLLVLNEILDFSLEEESVVNSDDDDIPTLAAVATYMRRDLHRNKDFYENVLPTCRIDEFKSHFRMTRGTFEALCREVWFVANSEVIRSVCDRFDVTLSSLNRIIHRVSGACVDLRQEFIKWPNGTS